MFNFNKDNKNNSDAGTQLKQDNDTINNDSENKESSFALYLLFSNAPEVNIGNIEKKIKSTGTENVKLQNLLEGEDTKNLYGFADIDGETFKLVGLDTSIPQEVSSYTVGCAYGDQEEIEAMKNHTYHIIAFYTGSNTDYNIIYNAYAKLAYGFSEDNFVGMANGYAWNAVTPSLVKGLFEDERIEEFASTPAMMVWRNFIKIPYNDKVWFVTKGNNVYGVHEYAYKGDSLDDSQQVYDMFEDIFNYEYTIDTEIRAGHTLQIGEEVFLRFKDLYEIKDDLQGEGIGTLVLELVTRDEINLD
ncbi:MAG: hypothetical protein Q4F66_03975 [Clostridium sp.]|nr:hypothetical protein [Clostridium sp.]